MRGCTPVAAAEQALSAVWHGLLDSTWPAWIGNLANVEQIVSPVIALLTLLLARCAAAGRLRPSSRSTVGSRFAAGAWSWDQETCMEDAGSLVDVILQLTGWPQVRLVDELRRTARLLGEAPPLGLDQVTINRWKKRRQKPGAYYGRLLQHLYGEVIAGSMEPGVAGADEVEIMMRRRFLQVLGFLVARSAVDPDRLDPLVDGLSKADGTLLDSLEAATAGYARLWHTAQPELLLPCVRHHFGALNDLRRRRHPPAIAGRLQGLAAEAAVLLGWEVYLTGDRSRADACYALALELARAAGHRQVSALALVARSFIRSVLFGAPREMGSETIGLLDEAVGMAAGTSSRHLQSFALTRRAEERAAAGFAEIDVRRDVDAAESALAGVRSPADGFFRYFDGGRIAGTAGTCAALLGDGHEAIRVLSRVITDTSPALAAERSVLVTDLAAVYARMDEVEYACDLLGSSLALGGNSGDVNRVERIFGVRRTLLEHRAAVPCVRRLDEQLELHRAHTT